MFTPLPWTFFAQAVAGPVEDVVAVAGASQDGRGRAIDLPAAQLLAGGHRPLHQGHGGVARGADRLECLHVPVGRASAGKAHPGDVSKHRAGLVELAPEVEQDELLGANRADGRSRSGGNAGCPRFPPPRRSAASR